MHCGEVPLYPACMYMYVVVSVYSMYHSELVGTVWTGIFTTWCVAIQSLLASILYQQVEHESDSTRRL